MEAQAKSIENPLYTYTVLRKSKRMRDWEESLGPRYWQYRKDWTERTAKRNYGEFPLCLSIEITTRCNLACTFCYHREFTAAEKGDMPFELYKKILDEAAEHGIPSINLNGIGEPLLHKDLPRMIAYAKQKGVIDIMFHTNATILNERRSRELIESGLDQLICSVDSPDKQVYESIRIHGKFDEVVANIRNFARIREEYPTLTPILRLTMVVTKATMHQVDDFYKMWDGIADLVTLQDLLYNHDECEYDLDTERIIAESLEHGNYFVCSYPYQRLMIHWNGQVTVCAQREAKEHLVLGNAWNDSLYDLWHSHAQQAVRKLHLCGKWYDNTACRNCDIALVELYKQQRKEKLAA